MKKLVNKITPLAFAFLLMSCTSDVDGLNKEMMNDIKEHAEKEIAVAKEAEKESTKEVETIVEETKGDEIQSRYAYDKDWEIIKSAILNKDAAKIQDWIVGDKVNSEDIIMLFSEKQVLDHLKNTSYKDLVPSEQEGEVMLEYAYQETAIDEDGNEVGMAIFIYLEQGDPNLGIRLLLAAG